MKSITEQSNKCQIMIYSLCGRAPRFVQLPSRPNWTTSWSSLVATSWTSWTPWPRWKTLLSATTPQAAGQLWRTVWLPAARHRLRPRSRRRSTSANATSRRPSLRRRFATKTASSPGSVSSCLNNKSPCPQYTTTEDWWKTEIPTTSRCANRQIVHFDDQKTTTVLYHQPLHTKKWHFSYLFSNILFVTNTRK